MQSTLLHVLLVESGLELSSVVTAGMLSNNPLVKVNIIRVSSLAEGLACLSTQSIDVALLDLGRNECGELLGLQQLQNLHPSLPIVALADDQESTLGLDAIRCGAQDLLPKSAISGSMLTRALLFATVRQHRLFRLKLAADHDQLTELPNRRCFVDAFNALDRSRCNSLALIDVDHFRLVNEHYGHVGGDQTLKHLGQLLSRELATSGRAYRYGGEEFALLIDASLEEAAHKLSQLLGSIESQGIQIGSRTLKLTVSAGLTQVGSSDTFLHAVQRCDRALYEAKAQGRNRLVVSGESSPHRPMLVRRMEIRESTEFSACASHVLPQC